MTIEITSNNLEWKTLTIAELYRRRWDIQIFFKLLKQYLNVKTFVGTSENAVKSQIFVALIAYLLLELLRRVTAKGKPAFSNFVEKIRICLALYLSLDYVSNTIKPIAQKAEKRAPPDNLRTPQQMAIGHVLKRRLFSRLSKLISYKQRDTGLLCPVFQNFRMNVGMRRFF